MEPAKPLILLAAMLEGARSHNGTVVIEAHPCEAAEAAREIAKVFDWRVETLEASHINLNDLDAPQSPLAQTIRHAVNSDSTYVIVIQGDAAALLADERSEQRLARLARSLKIILAVERPPGHLRGWRLADPRR